MTRDEFKKSLKLNYSILHDIFEDSPMRLFVKIGYDVSVETHWEKIYNHIEKNEDVIMLNLL